MTAATPGLDPDGRERLERELAQLRAQRRHLAADGRDDDPVGDRADQAVELERNDDLARMDARIREI
ncbi:MAG: GreA/GreB family elongation factor, partial [Pseudonocardia sp.]